MIKKEPSLKDVEDWMLEFQQVEAPVTHNFAEGVYVR